MSLSLCLSLCPSGKQGRRLFTPYRGRTSYRGESVDPRAAQTTVSNPTQRQWPRLTLLERGDDFRESCRLTDRHGGEAFGVSRGLTSSSRFVRSHPPLYARPPPGLASSDWDDLRRDFCQVLTSWKALRRAERGAEMRSQWLKMGSFDGVVANHKKDNADSLPFALRLNVVRFERRRVFRNRLMQHGLIFFWRTPEGFGPTSKASERSTRTDPHENKNNNNKKTRNPEHTHALAQRETGRGPAPIRRGGSKDRMSAPFRASIP